MSAREQLLQNNHKNGSRPKYYNKNIDTSNTAAPPWDTIDLPWVLFESPYEDINSMDNTHKDTYLVDTQ